MEVKLLNVLSEISGTKKKEEKKSLVKNIQVHYPADLKEAVHDHSYNNGDDYNDDDVDSNATTDDNDVDWMQQFWIFQNQFTAP